MKGLLQNSLKIFLTNSKILQLILILHNLLCLTKKVFLWRIQLIVNVIFYLFQNYVSVLHFSTFNIFRDGIVWWLRIMVRVMKNLQKNGNCNFRFRFFLQVFEWWYVWYVLTSSNNIGSLTESGRSDLTILSTYFVYLSMLNFVRLGAFKIQINECICGLPLTSNSTWIA